MKKTKNVLNKKAIVKTLQDNSTPRQLNTNQLVRQKINTFDVMSRFSSSNLLRVGDVVFCSLTTNNQMNMNNINPYTTASSSNIYSNKVCFINIHYIQYIKIYTHRVDLFYSDVAPVVIHESTHITLYTRYKMHNIIKHNSGKFCFPTFSVIFSCNNI